MDCRCPRHGAWRFCPWCGKRIEKFTKFCRVCQSRPAMARMGRCIECVRQWLRENGDRPESAPTAHYYRQRLADAEHEVT